MALCGKRDNERGRQNGGLAELAPGAFDGMFIALVAAFAA
jgi:hypothetical protein